MMLTTPRFSLLGLRPDLEPYPGYRLCRVIGGGSFGEVWEADSPDGRVALKFMPCRDSLTAGREIRALQALRRLTHPNLLVVNRIWCCHSYVVLAMELAEGDLEDLLQAFLGEFAAAIVPELVCHYLSQVADGLDFLNARRHRMQSGSRLVAVQHCDIKPTNLLMVGDTIKVADFGLATLTSAPSQNHDRAGTPAYAAPEVFLGQVSERSDQFSLAVTYCRLRSGRMPFREVSTFRPHCLRERGPADLSMLSFAEQAIVARALATAPHDRWPSCREFIANLTRLFV